VSAAIRIEALCFQPLEAPLRSPFVIASGRLERLENLAVGLRLAEGAIGWGEIPILPGVTPESAAAVAALEPQAQALLAGFEADDWRAVSRRLGYRFAEYPGLRAGVEMALIDALARRDGTPLYRWLLGEQRWLRTDVTIPICAPEQAQRLAAAYAEQGFDTLKTKVGADAAADVDRLAAITGAAPAARLILDANGGFSPAGAMEFLASLARAGITPALLEQPVPRDDWAGLAYVSAHAGVPVAADESCRTLADARRIAGEGACQVINIKLAKTGVAEAVDIVDLARRSGLGLMIGGMVETRLAMGFSAHLAAAVGGFDWIDLDTPLLLAADPVAGGYDMLGPVLRLREEAAGHGGAPLELPAGWSNAAD